MNLQSETNDKRKKIWNIIRVVIYTIGVIGIIPYFFNIIALLIGIIYFIVFKDKWRWHGFMLALATALATNAPQRGFVEITGIYPLNLVIFTGFGTLGIYFGIRLIVWLSFKFQFSQALKTNINALNQGFRSWNPPVKLSVLILIILTPTFLWGSISIDFGVMFDNKPHLLWVHGPTTADPGTPFPLTVESWDQFERVSGSYKGTVSFTAESYNLTTQNPISSIEADLPDDYIFTGISRPSAMAYMINNGKDNGIHTFEISISTPGIHYIKVHDSLSDNSYYSNPIVVANHTSHIYWGDIHTHAIYSDGSGSPAHAFYYAEEVACLDFYSLTEHGEIVVMGKNWINKYMEAVENANQPDDFVTFPGMEYTNHKTGHFTCIFDGNQIPEDPLITSTGNPTPFELWDILDDFTTISGARVLALPHHTVKERYMQDWTYYNPKYVKIAEVTSTHGDCLFDQHHPLSYRGATVAPPVGTHGASITDALLMGHNLTLYASSDGHDGHPGHTLSHTRVTVAHQRPFTYWWTRIDKPYPGGLTAVSSPALDRSTIFSQLESRHIYANSDHGRPYLTFTVNGREVGGNSTVLVTNASTPRYLQIAIAQDGSPASTHLTAASVTESWQPNWAAEVEILKNGELLAQIPLNSPYSIISYNDTTSITGAEYENCIEKNGESYINAYSDNAVDPHTLNTDGRDFYIVRIVGENGRHSYIGPIWVKANQ